jgi:hypothetical protein
MSVIPIAMLAWLVALSGPLISVVGAFTNPDLIWIGQIVMGFGLVIALSLSSSVQAEYRRRGWK